MVGTLIASGAQASPRALGALSSATRAHRDGVVADPTMCTRGWRAGDAPAPGPSLPPSRLVASGGDGPAPRCDCGRPAYPAGHTVDDCPPLPAPAPLTSWHATRHLGTDPVECLYGASTYGTIGLIEPGEREMYRGPRLTGGRGKHA